MAQQQVFLFLSVLLLSSCSLFQNVKTLEERLGTKLDSQHGILVALIDRVRSLDNEIIRQDTLVKTILGVPQLIDSQKIAKAERDDQRKD